MNDGGQQLSRLLSKLSTRTTVINVSPNFLSLGGKVHFEWRDGTCRGHLSDGTSSAYLDEISRVYCRYPYRHFTSAEIKNDAEQAWASENSTASFLNVLDALDIPKLNCPERSRASAGKLSQYLRANALGLKTPMTVISNDLEAAKRFSSNFEVVFKSLAQSNLPSDEAIYTTAVEPSDFESDFDLQYSIGYFQRYIAKELELRITVVGDQSFACAIDSQRSEQTKVDWRRYDLPNTPHQPFDLPHEIHRSLVNLVKGLGLNYGAIDMVLDKSGNFVFLELNPDGVYDWVETLTGLPITKAIAEWLCRGE